MTVFANTSLLVESFHERADCVICASRRRTHVEKFNLRGTYILYFLFMYRCTVKFLSIEIFAWMELVGGIIML
jgi:hypothetical protein